MKRKKIGLIIIALLIILIVGIKIYFEIDNTTYSNKIEKMNDNNELTVQIEYSIEHKTLKMNGYEIHYYVSGKENKDLIVFLHPAFSDHRAFDQQIDFFAEKYNVITIDLIGHGLSKANKSKDKIDISYKHIEKILEIEGFEKTHLVGVSMGSLIAQDFALHYPNKTKSITVLGGYSINKDNKEVQKSQQLVMLGLLFRGLFSMKSFRRKTAEISCKTEKGQALFYKTASHYERKSFLVMQGLENVVKNRENTMLNCPILILAGEYDIDVAKKLAKEWYYEAKNSQYKIINDAGHCANIDEPLIFNKIVKEFIDNNYCIEIK